MKKTLSIILSFVMLFSVMTTVYVSGNATYSYNTVQNFDGFAENEINRANSHTKNEKGVKTRLVKSGSSFVTTKGNESSSTGEFIAYGKDSSMGFKAWANAKEEYIEVYVPVTAEMRQGAVGFRVWTYNRSITVDGFQLRFYAQKDGVEYVYRKAGYTMESKTDGYLELFFNDPEIAKHSQSPAYVNVDTSKVPDVSSYNMSEDLTYIGLMVKTGSTGAMGFDNFEIISSDEPSEEDTTVPTEPEEETTTTTTTQAPSYDGDTVIKEIIAGGEWIEGFWRNGVIDTATSEPSNNKRVSYNAFLKVLPNTTYTITTKLNRTSNVANAVNFKEYDADKTQLSATNYSAYDLDSNFTKKVTTSATTEYITISLWSTFDSTQSGENLYKNILSALETGNIAVSITGKVAVDELEVKATMKQGADLRLGAINGLRFSTEVDSAKIRELISDGATVEIGTLIAPADLLEGSVLTHSVGADKYIDVTYTAMNSDNTDFNYYETDTFVGSIINIKESNTSYDAKNGNITRNFIGRGYVKVTKDGRTFISYANYMDDNKANNTRSLKTVATAFRADATQSALYEAHKENVDKWASALLAVMEISQDMIGGNINVHDIVENADGTYTVTVSNQLRTTTQDWFYWAFKVEGAQGKKVTFQFSQGNRVGYYGAAVSHDLETWDWTNTKSGEGFTYTFGEDETTVYFAHSMLYHPERFYDVADELDLTVQTLCTSEGGNAVPYVKFGTGDKGIVLTARHHACESTGSYVLEGVLKQLATSDYIKENYTVMVVPFVDFDGVLAGDQGKNRAPHDHNRDYTGEFGDTDSSIYASVRAIRAYVENPANNVVQAYDSHSPWHISAENDSIFVYKKFASGDTRADNLETLLSMFKNNIDSNCFPYTGNYDKEYGVSGNTGTDGTVGRGFSTYMTKIPTLVCGTTFETGFFRSNGVKFTQENAVNTGKALGKAIIEFSETIGSK